MNPISNSQNPSLETHSDAYFRPIKLLNYLPLSTRRLAWTRDINNDLAIHGPIKEKWGKASGDSQPSSLSLAITITMTIRYS